MGNRCKLIVLTIGVLFAGASCSQEQPPLLDVEYAGWRQSTSATLNFPVPGHGPGLRRIFANAAAWEVQPDSAGDVTYPDGTIFIKEIYAEAEPAADATPAALTAMIKSETDERAVGGWIWVTRNLSTGAESVFRDEFCFNCHDNANEGHPYGFENREQTFQDYVFHPPWVEARAQ